MKWKRYDEAVEMVERQMIAEALRKYGGNRSHAARHLGLSRRGFLNKMTRYGLSEVPSSPE